MSGGAYRFYSPSGGGDSSDSYKGRPPPIVLIAYALGHPVTGEGGDSWPTRCSDAPGARLRGLSRDRGRGPAWGIAP